MLPHAVPWLALLGLLALKRNRTASAWWIWAPVLCGSFGLEALLRGYGGFIPSQPLDALVDALKAVSFGLAAVWLLSGYLAWKHRFLTFLAVLGILLGFGEATWLVAVMVSGGGLEAILTGVVVAFCALILSTGLSLAGLLCRKRYGPVRALVWSLLMILAVTSLVTAPFFLLALASSQGRLPIAEFLQSLALLAGINSGAAVIYLVLSFVCRFYRDRLKALLHLGAQELPPVVAPPPPAFEMTEAK